MGEQVKLLRKENQDLKKQLSEIQTNLSLSRKELEVNYEKQVTWHRKEIENLVLYAVTYDCPTSDTKPNKNDVQFLSNEYDERLKRLTNLETQ